MADRFSMHLPFINGKPFTELQTFRRSGKQCHILPINNKLYRKPNNNENDRIQLFASLVHRRAVKYIDSNKAFCILLLLLLQPTNAIPNPPLYTFTRRNTKIYIILQMYLFDKMSQYRDLKTKEISSFR